MTRLVLAACAALALLPLGSAAQAPGPLQRLLQAELARIPAKAGIYVKHLKTGEEATVRADESFNSASVIKIPVFVIGYQMAEKKTLDLDARVTIAKADKRGGSGVLRYHETTTREARFPCTATTCSINRRTWRGTRRGTPTSPTAT